MSYNAKLENAFYSYVEVVWQKFKNICCQSMKFVIIEDDYLKLLELRFESYRFRSKFSFFLIVRTLCFLINVCVINVVLWHQKCSESVVTFTKRIVIHFYLLKFFMFNHLHISHANTTCIFQMVICNFPSFLYYHHSYLRLAFKLFSQAKNSFKCKDMRVIINFYILPSTLHSFLRSFAKLVAVAKENIPIISPIVLSLHRKEATFHRVIMRYSVVEYGMNNWSSKKITFTHFQHTNRLIYTGTWKVV